ncbi:TTN, partial [Symbiodinium necroappetens]
MEATINRQAAMKLRARLLSSWLTPDQALQSAGLRDRWRLTEAELRELFEAEVEAASSPEQVSLEKQRAISAAGRWRLRVEAGVQRLCAQLQKQDPDSLLPMILRRELLFALSQSAPREGFRAWAARRCTANDWEELRHAGPASGYLDLESFCEMVVLEAGHIDDAKEWFQHLKDLTDGSTCISYALLRQTAVGCPKLPGAADSAAPWEPTELLPRLLSVWTDLTEAFGWERQELRDVIRDRQQDKLTQTAGPRVSHQQWLYALRGKPEWPLLSETEAQEEAHRLGALGLTADRLFPNLSDRLQVTKNLFLPGELIVVRYTLSDFGHYGVCGPSPMVLGPDLPLGKAPFVAAVPAQPELAGFEEAWSRSALDVSLVRGAVRLRAPGALRGTSAFWHLRIFASDDGRTPTSAVSAPLLIQVMTVPPAPPSEVVAEGRDTSISFKWAECAQNGGAAVDRYDIALRYAESSKLAWTGHAQEPVITATSLTPDCDYTVQVRAANRAGCGPWSPGFAARTAARPPPPQVLAVGRETVLLRLPVEKAGNLTGYVVKAVCCTTGEPETSGDSEIVKRSGPKQTEVLLTGLLCATSYRLCAARLNASDQGPWSTCIQVRTKAGTPLPPESLTCLETKQEELCVSWSPPPRDGGAAICGYVLRAVCGPGSKDSVLCK